MNRWESLVETIGSKSRNAKILILCAIVLFISGGYWYFVWSPKDEILTSAKYALEREERKLIEYEAVAKELPKFEREFKRLNNEFEIAANKLPEQKEIPSLIDAVYAAVSASGLESVAFTPKGEEKKDIYAEIPIDINVHGSYYELAGFFDKVSRLPRIVNVRDLNLTREDKQSKTNNIVLNATFTAVTFRLLPPNSDELEEGNGKKKAKVKRANMKKKAVEEAN